MKSLRRATTSALNFEHKVSVFPMERGKPLDWKKELKMYCPCFSADTEPFGLVSTPCFNPASSFRYWNGCPAYALRRLLSAGPEEQPTKQDLILALFRLGCMKRVQVVFAVFELFKGNYAQAASSVESVLRKIKKGLIPGRLLKDDLGRLTYINRIP